MQSNIYSKVATRQKLSQCSMRIGALIVILLLAGCAAATPAADGGSYGSVEDLRDAYVAAGGDCDGWSQDNQVTLAAESGVCDSNTVLSTYTSQDAKEEIVATVKAVGDVIGGYSLLVGVNWIINSPDAKDAREVLGGTLVFDD